MQKIAASLFLLLLAPLTRAAVINVEFKFTPFVGDPSEDEKVTTVAGKAAVFINNVPFTEQEVEVTQLPVLSDEHEVTPAVWVPMSSVGPVVRKGTNKLRIEFTPNDPGKSYRAQLRWASVTDEPVEEAAPGSVRATNQANEGVDDRKALKGKVVFEREFAADFALDLPWHHYPPVASLTEEDKQKIGALLQARAEWFKPDFAPLYRAIEENESLKVDDVQKAQCLEAANPNDKAIGRRWPVSGSMNRARWPSAVRSGWRAESRHRPPCPVTRSPARNRQPSTPIGALYTETAVNRRRCGEATPSGPKNRFCATASGSLQPKTRQ